MGFTSKFTWKKDRPATMNPMVATITMVVMVVMCGWGTRQVPAQNSAADPADEAALSIHFTPDMAQAIGGKMADDMIIRHYQIEDDATKEQVREIVSKRLMQTFSALDTDANRNNLEEVVNATMRHIIGFHEKGYTGISKELGMSWGQNIKPWLPEFRDMFTDISQQVRPMLPMKQQLKMAGDLMAVKTAFDSFETVLDRWAAGDVNPYEHPFDPDRNRIERDEDGLSKALKRARERAAKADALYETYSKRWERYLAEAKQFYNLNPEQIATGESVLREMNERLAATTQESRWKQRWQESRFWELMLREFRKGWHHDNHPFQYLVSKEKQDLTATVEEMDREFKQRIERIPTNQQIKAAEESIRLAIAERKLNFEDIEVNVDAR